jgi:glycosyltransferase involved in cell wall biosynthesis
MLLEEFACSLFSPITDLFHGLNQRLPRHRFRRAVTTFHDLFVMSGEYSSAEFRRRFSELAREAAARSDHIIAISEYTAGQVCGLLDYPSDHVTVIPHGVTPPEEFPPERLQTFRREMGLDRPFLLHIGAIQPRKNVARLIEAFEGLAGEPLLVLAGAAGYGAEAIEARIDRSRASDRIRRLGYVDSERRTLLYRTAAVLAFPSLDEGFGLPILEAMAAGLPVVTSNRSAMPEAAGGAAVLTDPLEAESIRLGLAAVLADELLREKLIAAGRRRAAEFTWAAAAERTLGVYRRLAS